MILELTQGKYALIDDCDFPLARYCWYYWLGYAVRQPNGSVIRLDKVVCERAYGPAPPGKPYVHHLSGDTLDCRRGDLEWSSQRRSRCTPPLQAGEHVIAKRPGYYSPHLGVTWAAGKWLASIRVDGKRLHIGYFDSEAEAARAYDREAVKLGRRLNFTAA